MSILKQAADRESQAVGGEGSPPFVKEGGPESQRGGAGGGGGSKRYWGEGLGVRGGETVKLLSVGLGETGRG